ncbi:hypothetical protein NFI96_022414, partial [Prochilodus magdalenae]
TKPAEAVGQVKVCNFQRATGTISKISEGVEPSQRFSLTSLSHLRANVFPSASQRQSLGYFRLRDSDNISLSTSQGNQRDLDNTSVNTSQGNQRDLDNTSVSTSQGNQRDLDNTSVSTSQGNQRDLDNTSVNTSQGNQRDLDNTSVSTSQGNQRGLDNTSVNTSQGNQRDLDNTSVSTSQGNQRDLDNTSVNTSQGNQRDLDNTSVNTSQGNQRDLDNTSRVLDNTSVSTSQGNQRDLDNTSVNTSQGNQRDLDNTSVSTSQGNQRDLDNTSVNTSQGNQRDLDNTSVNTSQGNQRDLDNTSVSTSQGNQRDFVKISKMSSDLTEPDYILQPAEEIPENTAGFLNHIRMMYIVVYFIICCLGMILNSYVIIVGFRVYNKIKKPATVLWVLALALTHLVFSLFLVLQFLYAWHYFNWLSGTALCKLSSYVIYASMYSTAALLSLWSVSSRCSEGIKCRSCGVSTVLLMVLSSWMFGLVLSIPSLIFRELRYTEVGQECIDDFNTETTTSDGVSKMIATVVIRFLLGVLVPALTMIASAYLARSQGRNLNQSWKRITSAIKVGYLFCWTPVLFLGLIQATAGNSFDYALPVTTVLAAAHCFINPLIYLFVGRNLNMNWMSQEPSNANRESQDDGENMDPLNDKN